MTARRLKRKILAGACTAALALQATASGAAAQGMNPGNPPVPREHAAAVETYGGLYTGPAAAYVAQVGGRVAQVSGHRAACGFHVVNSDVVNAFTSPPGCHVYITRGLLGLLSSEDELAAVLGHEVGHVTANHAGKRQQRSTITGLGALILGAATGSNDLARLASGFGQLNVLSYSRAQELQSDQLAVRYLTAAGYSPYALADVITALQGQEQLMARVSGREQKAAPAWAQTHPLHGDRITRAVQHARATGQPPGPEREAEYLARIDGLVFGDDPRQGFVEGRRFIHPDLGIAFEAPPGFTLTNGSSAVKIEGQGGQQALFSTAPLRGGLEAYAEDALRRAVGQTQVQTGRPERTRINGLEAVILPARAQSQRGWLDLTVAAYATGPDTAYHFVTLGPANSGRTFEPLIGSFRRLSREEARTARPRVIQVVQVRPGETVQSLSGRMAVEAAPEAHFRLLNGLRDGDELRPGQRVKIVAYEGGPARSARRGD
ncbi:M48 family metalloprotease [Phenylobacterium sp. J426]|uniref:M48 family metalloprotease n=1 Tax=Phenylobacterium sp. J426 TaxID=2898439 RepID=UPI0021518086|nr:M48 family metalloprotease [Phenylobacterium sp. J426]MCR5875531.1 M48 family metalloprotease [Phenylobacterium sp. J426]